MVGAKCVDVLIIGGGPAGLAAALELNKKGVENILIVEREQELGGILRQCIHDGFGLTRFGCSMSGPEYAARFIEQVKEKGIKYLNGATVYSVTQDRIVTVVSKNGLVQYSAKAIILSMGCRERTRGALAIPGERPAGVFTAGVAQSYINLFNEMPAKEAVILGSGDIGLIMARRLTLEGVLVKAVYEIQSYPSGLQRNIEQCLNDYDIPLKLGYTVVDIHGDKRITGITVAKVDDRKRPVDGTSEYVPCDTLILSVGLIPENELSREAGVILDDRTKGAVVDEHYMTSAEGIFAAGNVLHVHDLVDHVSLEAEKLADNVAEYLKYGKLDDCKLKVSCDDNIAYTVPMSCSGKNSVQLSFRVKKPMRNITVNVRQGRTLAASKRIVNALPAQMIQMIVPENMLSQSEDIEVSVNE